MRLPLRFAAGVALPAVVLAAGLTGCASVLRNRQLTVYFKAGTTNAQLAAASRICGHIEADINPAPNPTAAPGQSLAGLAGDTDEIRFYVHGADDHDLAQVTNCLNKQPGVVGVQAPDDDMS
jgi:hypothetical protein